MFSNRPPRRRSARPFRLSILLDTRGAAQASSLLLFRRARPHNPEPAPPPRWRRAHRSPQSLPEPWPPLSPTAPAVRYGQANWQTPSNRIATHVRTSALLLPLRRTTPE